MNIYDACPLRNELTIGTVTKIGIVVDIVDLPSSVGNMILPKYVMAKNLINNVLADKPNPADVPYKDVHGLTATVHPEMRPVSRKVTLDEAVTQAFQSLRIRHSIQVSAMAPERHPQNAP